MVRVCIEKRLCVGPVLLTIFRLKIIMPVQRIEIFTNFVSANDEKHQPK